MLDKIENSHKVLNEFVEGFESKGYLPPDVYADLLVCIATHKKLEEFWSEGK